MICGYDVLSRTAASEFTARYGRPPRWVVAEDDLIKRFPIALEKENVRVVPVDKMFEK